MLFHKLAALKHIHFGLYSVEILLCGLLVTDALQIAANIAATLTRFASRCRVQVLAVDLPLSCVKSLVINLDVSISVKCHGGIALAFENQNKGCKISSLGNNLVYQERMTSVGGFS